MTDDLESMDNSREIFSLWGFYSTRGRMVFSCRRFETTCRPRLGGSSSLAFFLDCLTVEYGTGRLFRNVGKNPPFYTACNKIPKERICLLCHGRNLKLTSLPIFLMPLRSYPYGCYKLCRSFITPQPTTKFYLSSFESQHSEEAGCTSVDRLAALFKRD